MGTAESCADRVDGCTQIIRFWNVLGLVTRSTEIDGGCTMAGGAALV